MALPEIELKVQKLFHRGVDQIGSPERGHSAVEVAIVLLLLFSVTFGMIDFGRYVYTTNVLRAAVQGGARSALIEENSITATMEKYMNGLDMRRIDVAIEYRENVVRVSATYDFAFITPLAHALVDTVDLRASASMMKK